MKINNKSYFSKHKVTIIGLVCFIITIAISYCVYSYFTKLNTKNSIDKSNSINYDKPTDEQKNAGNLIENNSTSGSDKPAAPVKQDNGKSLITVSMTTPNNNSYKKDEIIYLRFLIGANTSTGKCTLTLNKTTASPIVIIADSFQSGATTSTCKGFDIKASDLAIGTWSIQMDFANDMLYGSVTGNIIIE